MTNAQDKDLDAALFKYIQQFKFKAVERESDFNKHLIRLGSKLFGDLRLSQTGDKSCFACHLDFLDSGEDDLPLSLGVDTIYATAPSGIYQNTAKTTKRNATHLYNKGHEDFKFYFIDGKVSFENNKWITPAPKFNSNEMFYVKLRSTVDSPLAVQALFPMVDVIEMRGEAFAHLSNQEVWEKITNDLLQDPNLKRFFHFAYPNVEINIGHIANALALFQKYYFQVTQTPWDKYLRGDLNAMTETQKRGAIIFSTKAKCVNCHFGTHLTNFEFMNNLVPGISQQPTKIDYGRYEVTKKVEDNLKSIVPPLRNIGRT